MAISLSIRHIFITLILNYFVLSPAIAQSRKEQRAFQEAKQYYEAGIRQFDNLQKQRYLDYAIGLYNKNTYRFLVDRHRRGPYVGQASRQTAYLAISDENWEEAAKYFQLASQNLSEKNLRQSALTKHAECLLKLNRQAEVTVALRSIIDEEKHPHKGWASFMLAFQYFEKDDFKTTIQLLKALVTSEQRSQYHSQAIFYTHLASAELALEDTNDSHLRTVLNMSINTPSLTPDQRRSLATNKTRAQISLMGLYSKKKDWGTVINLYEKGDFGASGKLEARRCERAGLAYLIKQDYRSARACYRRVDRALPKSHKAFEASFKCLECDYCLKNPNFAERVDIFFELYAHKYPDHKYLYSARFLQAETLYNRKALEDAAQIFANIDRSVLDDNMQRELLFKYGWCLSESGQFDGAGSQGF